MKLDFSRPFVRKIARMYKDTKLRYKLSVTFSVFVLFPILLIGVSSQYISQKYMVDAEKKSLIQGMNQLNNTIDYFFETYMNKSQMLFSNIELQEAIAFNNENMVDVIASRKKINDILVNQVTNDLKSPEMKSSYYFGGTIQLKIYAANETLTSDGGSFLPFTDIEDEPWCRELYESKKLFSWQCGLQLSGNEYIAINRRLLDFKDTKDIGVLQICIPVMRVKSILEKNASENADTFIYTDGSFNRIMSFGEKANNDDLLGRIKKMNPVDGIKEIEISNKQYLVGILNSDITGWKLIYVTPTEQITKKTGFITTIIVLTMIVSILLCILIATLTSSFVTRRIGILVDKTNRIKAGNLLVNLRIEGNDEIGQLDENFNSMIDRLNHLIENDYKSRIFISKTKFELLQEQINPHLLYNTLSMIGLISRKENQTEILNVTNNLINFYKGILNRGKVIAAIHAEIEMVKKYISITKVVYRLDIETSIEIDSEILGYYSIKLFLQPIVENAIVHGIKSKKSGSLRITGRMYDDTIEFLVMDDGTGMSEEVQDYFATLLKSDRDDKGYGLSNVIRRINLFFGDRYGIDIDSTPGAGSTVKIRIPVLDESQIRDLLESKYLLN